MDIIALLGVYLDRIALEYDFVGSSVDVENGIFYLTVETTPQIQEYAESLLDLDDYVEIERNEYNTITIAIQCDRVIKIYYGNEEHEVKEVIDNYVNDWNIEDIYLAMCGKMISFYV